MASCTCENWTLEDLASALQSMHKDNKKIAVPMFQRGKRWNKKQQETFIDSLIKGYPVGTMLFYETIEDGHQTYILVDGLQRGNSIKTYINNPTDFFYDNNISDEFCQNVLSLLGVEQTDNNYAIVRSILTDFIKEQRTFKNLQYFKPAEIISQTFHADFSCIGALIEVIVPTQSFTNKYMLECIARIESFIGESLIKRGRSTYCTTDRKKGFVFSSSKAYEQGKRKKYWFAYRLNPFDDISDCQEKYIVYGCKDTNELLLFPALIIDSLKERLNHSNDENGNISHWHIVFLRDNAGHMTQLLSHPELTEVDIDGYKI